MEESLFYEDQVFYGFSKVFGFTYIFLKFFWENFFLFLFNYTFFS